MVMAHGSSLSEPLGSQSLILMVCCRHGHYPNHTEDIRRKLENSFISTSLVYTGKNLKFRALKFSRAQSQSVSKQDKKPVMVPGAVLDKL